MDFRRWPVDVDEAIALQESLGARALEALEDPWSPPPSPLLLGGCFVTFDARDRAWAAAALVREGGTRPEGQAVVEGSAGFPYVVGLLALREGPLLEAAVRALPRMPDCLLVNAGGADHPRRAGLATHLGAVLGVPTVGVTERPVVAACEPPGLARGESSPLVIGDDVVGFSVRTRSARRPVLVSAGWRVTAETARDLVLQAASAQRTPQPLRVARRLARVARTRTSI
ncbi:MAG: endonuclease V [Actinomycetota bacterium]